MDREKLKNFEDYLIERPKPKGIDVLCDLKHFIRKLSLNDVPELTTILSDPDVMKYSIRGVCDEAATRRFIEWCLECYVRHGIGPWALVEKNSDTLIGFCGISPEDINGDEEISLGYRLAKQYWRKGFASEAAKAVLAQAFDQQKLPSVAVIIEPENVASLKVTEGAGFSEFDIANFHNRPVRVYQLTAKQWDILHEVEKAPLE